MELMISDFLYEKMMTWYTNYVSGFYASDRDFNGNIDLKKNHTMRVIEEIRTLGESLTLSDDQIRLAMVMGLFHDIGRFEQFRRYGLYLDCKTEDHAMLGIKILKDNGVLNELQEPTRQLVLCAIEHHNKKEIPQGISDECSSYTKLLRDADKLDIWHLAIKHYTSSTPHKLNSIDFGLPDLPQLSEEIINDLQAGTIARSTELKSRYDFILLQMGWVYDINYQKTFQIIRDRKYLESLYKQLPQNAIVDSLYKKMQDYLFEHC